MCDVIYGRQLSKFINDKNIDDIQLIKKEYISMDNLEAAEYCCRRRPTELEICLARQREADPNILSGKDRIFALYKMLGMEIDYDEIFAD